MRLGRRWDGIVLVASVMASGLASVVLGPDGSWDLRNYHYYNAYSFLHDRLTFDVAPAQIQSFLNPLLDVPSYWLMLVLSPRLYGFVVGGLHGLNLWLVYRIAYSLLADLSMRRRRLLSAASAITGYLGPAGVFEIGTSFHDNVTSLFVLSALLLILTSPGSPSAGRVAAAGVLVGVGTGLKLVLVVYTLPLAISLLLFAVTWKRKLTSFLTAGLGIVAGVSMSTGFWLFALWRKFGNPLFPVYNRIFKSPYYTLSNYIDHRFSPPTKHEALFYPFYFVWKPELVAEGPFRDFRFPMCYVALLLVVFTAYYRKVTRAHGGREGAAGLATGFTDAARFITAFVVLSYILWLLVYPVYRYLLPLELLAPTFLVLMTRAIFPFERVLVRLSLLAFALIVVTMRPLGGWSRPFSWPASVLDVRVPAAERVANAVVIMADNAPLSYIIPAFPATTRFVSVRNNFMRPALKTKLEERAYALIDSNAGNLYLLYMGKSEEGYGDVLDALELKMQEAGILRIATPFKDDLFLVPVARPTRAATEAPGDRYGGGSRFGPTEAGRDASLSYCEWLRTGSIAQADMRKPR